MTNIAVFPGSFDPFTNGHMDVVKQAARLFDRVYVVIGTNPDKTRAYDAAEMRDAIACAILTEGIRNCTVCVHDGLTTAFAEAHGADYIVRGLRDSTDFAYEETLAAANKLLCPAVETVYLRAAHAAVSASMVRELRRYGADVAPYVPPIVLSLMGVLDNKE